MTSFNALALHPSLERTLAALHYHTPTEIQARAIPEVLAGHDVIAKAQTGTGKTAAFALPLLHLLLTQPTTTLAPRALILTPTRELAQQVGDSFNQYGEGLALRTLLAYGGVSLRPQISMLQQGCDIVVATPGRLLDLAYQQAIDLTHIQYLVLDEADRMLDLGFADELQRILAKLPKQKQTLFFSATYNQAVKDLAYSLLNQPKLIEVTPHNTAVETVQQTLYSVNKQQKNQLLAYLIGSGNWQQVLVFVRTKQGADELCKQLKLDGLKATSLHGDKSQGARSQALAEFKQGSLRILVATDVAARGIDISQLDYVVNYELPYHAEDYIHRVGRTGRAGQSGHAISFVARDEEYLLEAIEKLLNQRLVMQWYPGFEPALDEPKAISYDQQGKPRSRSNQARRAQQKQKNKARAQAGFGVKKK